MINLMWKVKVGEWSGGWIVREGGGVVEVDVGWLVVVVILTGIF